MDRGFIGHDVPLVPDLFFEDATPTASLQQNAARGNVHEARERVSIGVAKHAIVAQVPERLRVPPGEVARRDYRPHGKRVIDVSGVTSTRSAIRPASYHLDARENPVDALVVDVLRTSVLRGDAELLARPYDSDR